MGADSEVKVPDAAEKGHSLELLKGKLFMKINGPELKQRGAGEFKLKTPAALLAVKGTKFFTVSTGGTDTIGVHEGSVVVTEPTNGKSVTLEAGNAVTASPGVLSEMRVMTDEEKGYTAQYAAAELVRTPLTKLGAWGNFKDPKFKIASCGPPTVTADGIVRYTWKDTDVSGLYRNECGSFLEASPGRAIGIQFRMRTKNVVAARFTAPIRGTPWESAPVGASIPIANSDEGNWHEYLWPIPTVTVNQLYVDAKFDFRGFSFSTIKRGDKRKLPSNKFTAVDLTEFVLLSLPK